MGNECTVVVGLEYSSTPSKQQFIWHAFFFLSQSRLRSLLVVLAYSETQYLIPGTMYSTCMFIQFVLQVDLSTLFPSHFYQSTEYTSTGVFQ